MLPTAGLHHLSWVNKSWLWNFQSSHLRDITLYSPFLVHFLFYCLKRSPEVGMTAPIKEENIEGYNSTLGLKEALTTVLPLPTSQPELECTAMKLFGSTICSQTKQHLLVVLSKLRIIFRNGRLHVQYRWKSHLKANNHLLIQFIAFNDFKVSSRTTKWLWGWTQKCCLQLKALFISIIKKHPVFIFFWVILEPGGETSSNSGSHPS